MRPRLVRFVRLLLFSTLCVKRGRATTRTRRNAAKKTTGLVASNQGAKLLRLLIGRRPENGDAQNKKENKARPLGESGARRVRLEQSTAFEERDRRLADEARTGKGEGRRRLVPRFRRRSRAKPGKCARAKRRRRRVTDLWRRSLFGGVGIRNGTQTHRHRHGRTHSQTRAMLAGRCLDLRTQVCRVLAALV